MRSENLEKMLEFLHVAGKLKKIYRFNADPDTDGDSSADHSWRLALMAFVLADELKLDVNVNRAMKIALVHDIAEALTGDVDARHIKENKVTEEEKKRNESEAMGEICATLPEKISREIMSLWREYGEAKTKEARYIKALDKIETQIQTLEFGHGNYNDSDLIGIYGLREVKDCPELKKFFLLVKSKLKGEFEKGGFEWKKEYEEF